MNAIVNEPVQESGTRKIRGESQIGRPFRPGNKGKPKGAVNKTTRTLKQAILEATKRAGDNIRPNGGMVAYLQQVAETAPQTFMPLLWRVLPLDVTSSDGSMRPVVALYMPDNRRDEPKLVQDVRPVIDVDPTPAGEDDTPALPVHSSATAGME